MIARLETTEFEFNLGAARSAKLNELQKQYFAVFQKEKTVQKTVEFFLASGWLVNFNQILDLLKILDHARALSPSLNDIQRSNSAGTANPQSAAAGLSFPEFCRWPFYRSLPSPVQSLLWKSHKMVSLPAGAKLFKSGDPSRDLWTQVSGQSAIFMPGPGGSRKLVCLVDPKATFGELGSFLDRPRSADVEVITASKYIKIPYGTEMDQLIRKEAFETMRARFNVLRAILHSELFQQLPEPTIDEMIFSGKLIEFKQNSVIFKQGDAGACCYFVIQGQVGVFKDGKMLARLSQGSALGEIALFWAQGQRTASAIAQTDTLLLEIQQKEFYSILAKNLELAAQIETLSVKRGESDLLRNKKAV